MNTSNQTRNKRDGGTPAGSMSKETYRQQMPSLQIELVKLQKHFISCEDKILVLIEGRDAAGKDGVIKRITQHLSPRETRVVALGKPSDRERHQWYFQRFVAHLPAPQEFVLFNRSWYNRAGVERVMGFCTDAEYAEFMDSVVSFESMLVSSGIRLLKYYLDISKQEQKKRLKDRRSDPLKQWKISPIDHDAVKLWSRYSRARDHMLAATHSHVAPWTIVTADDKRSARVNIVKDILSRLHYAGKDKRLVVPDPKTVHEFSTDCLENGMLAP